jgi:hypothetical protein
MSSKEAWNQPICNGEPAFSTIALLEAVGARDDAFP